MSGVDDGVEDTDNVVVTRPRILKIRDRARQFVAKLRKPQSRSIVPGKVYQLVSDRDYLFYVTTVGPHPLSQLPMAYGVIITEDSEVPAMKNFDELGPVINL